MDLKQVVQWLLDNKYGLVVNNQFVLTQKLNQELFDRPITNEVATVQVNQMPEVVVVATTVPVSSPDNKKTIWNEFIERCAIPHRVKATDGGVYTVRQFSPSAVNKLIQIIKDPLIEYDRLVESTKHYYATVSYKALLSNYLLKDIWRGEYDNFKPGNISNTGDGSSRWED